MRTGGRALPCGGVRPGPFSAEIGPGPAQTAERAGLSGPAPAAQIDGADGLVRRSPR